MTREELLQHLEYSPETGIFTWKTRRQGRRNPAGCLTPSGYITISIDYKSYPAHRLAWLYVYGYMPSLLDHINRNPSDNRITNLREATPAENGQNRGTSSNNTSGHTGVTWSKRNKRWQVYLFANKKLHRLGNFISKEEAAKVYRQKKAELHTFQPVVLPADLSVKSMTEKARTSTCRKLMVNPETGIKGATRYTRSGRVLYAASFRVHDKTYKVMGFQSAEAAGEAAQSFKEQMLSGAMSPDELNPYRRIHIGGVSRSREQWAKHAGIDKSTIYRRMSANRTTFKQELMRLLPKEELSSIGIPALKEPADDAAAGLVIKYRTTTYRDLNYHYLEVKFVDEYIVTLSGFTTKEAALEEKARLLSRWQAGDLTIPELKGMRKNVVQREHKSVKGWAAHLGVSTTALYKEARRNSRTVYEEISHRLGRK